MPWASIGVSLAGSAISGALGSSSGKKAAKDARKTAKEQMALFVQQQAQAKNNLQPFINTGDAANQRLSDLLGLSAPKGYAPKPTRDQIYNQLASEHYQKYKTNYTKDSNMGGVANLVEELYQQQTKDWEEGLKNYNATEGDYSSDYGSLLDPFTNDDFIKDPGYQFRLNEGTKGIDRASAARGGYDSGSTLKALARYNQDYASNEFGNAYNRDASDKSRTYGFLSGTAGAGQNAAGTLAGLGANAANSQANALGQGTAQANQYNMQGAEAWNNAIQSGIGNSLYAMRTAQTAPVVGYSGGSSIYGSGGASNQPAWYLS